MNRLGEFNREKEGVLADKIGIKKRRKKKIVFHSKKFEEKSRVAHECFQL